MGAAGAAQGAQERAQTDGAVSKNVAAGGQNKALVVGINNYAGPNQLPSCVNDANTIAALLKSSFVFDNISVLTDEQATKAGLIAGLKALFQNAGPADRLVFFFSGHGYRPIQNNVVEEALVTQDSQFFGDDELAGLMQGLPGGVLTIILDACFSGGMEKLFLQPSGKVEFGKVKRWTSLDPAEVERHLQASGEVSGFSPFGVLSPATSQIVRTHLANGGGKGFQAQPFEVTELRSSDSRGLLLSACLDSEEAAASTSQTAGLSAFTFALTSSINRLGANAVVKDLIAASGSLLRQIGIGQTPMLKEPSVPPDLGSTSFVLFRAASEGAKAAESSRVGNLSAADIQNLVRSLTSVLTINAGGENMDSGSLTQKDWGQALSTILPIIMTAAQNKGYQPGGKDWIDDVSRTISIAAPIIASLQSTGGQPNGKDWIDDVGRVANIVAPLVTNMQSKGFQPENKNWLHDVAGVVQTAAPIIAATMQSKGYVPGSKDWLSDIGDVARLVVPLVAGMQSKGYQPNNKDWLNDVSRIVQIAGPIVAATMQSNGTAQPNKDWIDDVGNIARVVVPLVASMQSKAA
jgi:hypothetical protein